MVAAAACGILVGAVAGLLTLLLYAIENIALGFVENIQHPGPIFVPEWRRAISVIIGAAIAATAWYMLRNHCRSVPSVKRAVAGDSMPFWQTVAHVLLQIFIVGTGMSIGREVAPREMGALIGQKIVKRTGLDGHDARTLVASTAAAGLAGVYNAPLAGTFFAVEILLKRCDIETVSVAFIGSATAAWTASLVKGAHTFYAIGDVEGAPADPGLMLFAAVSGVVLGLFGALFRYSSQWAEKRKATDKHILWELPMVGVLTAFCAFFIPQIMGNGRAVAQMSFMSDADMSLIPFLLLACLAKCAMTLLTIRSGASGGVLQPGIALGASAGAVLGILWAQFFPSAATIGTYALIGACALLSASQQAPLMAMCLVAELAEAPIYLFVPIGLAVAIGSFISLKCDLTYKGKQTRQASGTERA